MADAPADADAALAGTRGRREPRDAPDAPLVSVVIPTLNRQGYLRIALQSALAQTLTSLEIIVQDNASTADPRAVVEGLCDPRVAYHRQSTAVAQVENVVSACARARGKYIAILGDDDVWKPKFLATLVGPLEADASLVVAFCDHEIIDTSGRPDAAAADRISKRYGRHGLGGGAHH